jgi:hypothetical protein
MLNSTERRAQEKAERDAEEKARRRAEQAQIVEGLRTVLDGDEQLLAFARGRIAGGWRGKLNVGPEAFFAPFVNIGLTERRFILQHIHPEDGRPSEILPHFFPLSEIEGLTFSDIETFGAEQACRLILRLNSDQHFRLRLRGQAAFESAEDIVKVFNSLTSVRPATMTPTQSVCATCGHIIDQPSKFCPYCGARRTDAQATGSPPTGENRAPEPPGSPTVAATEELRAEIGDAAPAEPSVEAVSDVAEPVPPLETEGAANVEPVVPPVPPEFPAAPTPPTPPVAPASAEEKPQEAEDRIEALLREIRGESKGDTL